MQQGYGPGSAVIVRDQQWRVARVDAFESCSIVTLDAGGDRLRVITPFDRVEPVRRPGLTYCKRSSVIRIALATAVSERPATGLWTAAAAAIDLLPYQLEPALAVLGGSTRLLLADAVGLGKTIQAGLILSELRERGLVERALIVCPAGLKAGWARELQRFGLNALVIDQTAIAELTPTLPPEINPWMTHAIAIASIDFVKRPEVMAALASVPLDLLIADEAHHLTPGTERGDAVHSLASRTPWLILMTATPHSGDEGAFEYLTRVGEHEDALTVFKRTHRDAGLLLSRRERLIRMRSGADEAALLAAVDSYARSIWQGIGATDRAVQLVAITIARRAASSTLALERTLLRRLALLGSTPDPVQARLDWDEADDSDGAAPAELLSRPGLGSDTEERATIERLLQLIARCGVPAKLEWVARAIPRLEEPVIIFTEYRDTLDALMAQMPNLRHTATISGITPIDARRTAVDAFNRGDVDVLIATDTAGEGLNLHQRCRLVIDVELPWNPLRLEQRLGRVDRLGQRKRVHAWRLFYPDTIEARVLECLQLRRHRASRFDNRVAIDEHQVGAAVFDDREIATAAMPVLATTVIEGAQREHDRLTMERRLRTRGSRRCATLANTAKWHAATGAVVALHSTIFINGFGAVLAEHPSAHLIHVVGRGTIKRSVLLASIARCERLQAAAAQARDRKSIEIDCALQPMRHRLAFRIGAIRSRLMTHRRAAMQRSLFDQRADRAVAAEQARRQALVDALDRRLRSIVSPLDVDATVSRLVALWPVKLR
jgi:superfamily II DNA or RNA helicase